MSALPHASHTMLSAAAERRRGERRPHAPAYLSSPTGGERIEVLSSDLSRRGICLTVKRAIPSGTFHRLELGPAGGQSTREIRIVACQARPDGSFHAHAEFC